MRTDLYKALLLFALSTLLTACQSSVSHELVIIDAHMHLYDTTRPQGVSWPQKKHEAIYRPFLPEDYRSVAEENNIGAAVVVLTGDWDEDNQWNLEQIHELPGMFPAFIGYIDLNDKDFKTKLDLIKDEPQFKGIRIIHKSPEKDINDRMMTNIGYLADQGKVLEILGVFYKADDIKRIAQAYPDLSIVLSGYSGGDAANSTIGPFANVHIKVGGRLSEGVWETFGEDRLIFGSDWPSLYLYKQSVPGKIAPLLEQLNNKGRATAGKIFRGNAIRVYDLDR